MRFYEFIDTDVIDVLNEHLSRQPYELLTEEEKTLYTKCEEFINRYTTSPDDLVIGDRYYAFSIIAQPNMKLMTVEYADSPVIFNGMQGNRYEFTAGSKTIKLPVEGKSNSMVYSTVVYEEVEKANSFLTMVMLTFSGVMTVQKREIKI